MKIQRTKLISEIVEIDADSFEGALEEYNSGEQYPTTNETIWYDNWSEVI